jgi:hypothetical protein
VNGSRSLSIDVAGETARNTELGDQVVQTEAITGVLGLEVGKGVLEPKTGEDGWSAMTYMT